MGILASEFSLSGYDTLNPNISLTIIWIPLPIVRILARYMSTSGNPKFNLYIISFLLNYIFFYRWAVWDAFIEPHLPINFSYIKNLLRTFFRSEAFFHLRYLLTWPWSSCSVIRDMKTILVPIFLYRTDDDWGIATPWPEFHFYI